MSDRTKDGGLKPQAATLVESPTRPLQAKKTRSRVRQASTKISQKDGRSGSQKGLGSAKHTPSDKTSSTGMRPMRKASDYDRNRHLDFLDIFDDDVLKASPPKYVNDPRLMAMASINLMGAELRLHFIETYPVVDEKSMLRLVGGNDSDKSSEANAWRSAGQVIGLPFVGITLYPAFQFQPDGQPYPLIQKVNKAFADNCTDWQRVSWLVSPNEWLNGEAPISAIQRNDPEVVDAAKRAYEVPVG